ncbi:MAG: ROK family protein [Negativicutes bacterium]|nr:ROK family protein [Negativicutes bacterium]
MKKYRLGIDLGGTNLVAALLDIDQIKAGRSGIIEKILLPTPWQQGYPGVAAEMAQLCRQLLQRQQIGIEQVAYAGIGSPGVIDVQHGIIVYTSNLHFQNAPITDALAQQLGLPVYLANDANAAALGEAAVGSTRGCRHSVVITLGTGVGGGVIADGKLLVGFNGAGGELGHHVIAAGGAECSCGRRGCWEAYSSATGLLRLAKTMLPDYPASLLWQAADATGGLGDCRAVFRAYDRGDAAAHSILAEYLKMLAVGIVNIVNLFQPEVLAIGGGLSARCDLFIPYLQAALRREVYAYRWIQQTKIVAATLGNDAGLIGAAILAEDEFIQQEVCHVSPL